MQNPFLVAISKSFKCHQEVRFDVGRWEEHVWIANDSFEVSLHELKHKVQVLFVRKRIDQENDMRML